MCNSDSDVIQIYLVKSNFLHDGPYLVYSEMSIYYVTKIYLILQQRETVKFFAFEQFYPK